LNRRDGELVGGIDGRWMGLYRNSRFLRVEGNGRRFAGELAPKG